MADTVESLEDTSDSNGQETQGKRHLFPDLWWEQQQLRARDAAANQTTAAPAGIHPE